MEFNWSVLDDTEKIIYALRSLYMRSGYRLYRMGKFEEYDLYSQNKDFLVSDTVITFMDTNGRLMALRPDVTLSIIKNNRDLPGKLQKLCYNEYVYRSGKDGSCFKEIMQTGLECFGPVDGACITEVLQLAMDSLKTVSGEYALLISSLDILSAFLDRISPDAAVKAALTRAVGEKNLHALGEICREKGLEASAVDRLAALVALKGSSRTVLPELEALCCESGAGEAFLTLKEAVSSFAGSDYENRIQIDFSVTGDINYYNGIVFKGYIAGLPGNVLSGGQYDRLMKKMGRKSRAIGFAVYLDLLERISLKETEVQ